jgi:hypothetical protein
MLRVLVEFGVPLVLFVFALVDCIQTDESLVRNLPKAAWILLIVLVPLVGSIAWLAAGRPTADQRGQGRRQVAWPATATSGFPEYERPGQTGRRTFAPDDDPEFLRTLGAEQRRHEAMLGDWEQDLRRREAALREGDTSGDMSGEVPPAPPAPDADPREPEKP